MHINKTPISIGVSVDNSRIPLRNLVFCVDVHESHTDMWKNIAKQISSRAPRNYCRNSSLSVNRSFLGFGQDSIFLEKSKFRCLFELNPRSGDGFPMVRFQRNGEIDGMDEFPSFSGRNQVNSYGLCCRSYASVAEVVEAEEVATAAHADVEEDSNVDVSVSVPGEVQELMNAMRKEERREYAKWRHQRNTKMGNQKYYALRKRQVKIDETEAWQQAAREYVELLNDMCEQKLAPNLPYMKSLFLGWFEPLRNQIAQEQEIIRKGKSKAAYAKYFDLLPAEMMAVITMHKLTALLMTDFSKF